AAELSVPLTEAQNEIWLAAQLGDDASCAFNESLTLRLSGSLDERAFAEALATVIARHDALRASFGTTGEAMHVDPKGLVQYETIDVAGDGLPAAEAALAAYVASDARRAFDLASGPLVRARMFALGTDEHAFVFTAHHIVCDGWSINVILDELAATYAAAHSGTPSGLPVPLSFSTYARRSHASDPARAALVEAYWHDQFATPVRPLDLPTDRPRPSRKTFNGATLSARIDERRYLAVKKAGARAGCTLFVTLLAGFGALMGRLGKRNDVVIGIPAAGQALLENEILVGHCVDFLPIRTGRDAATSLTEFLTAVKRRVLDAYEHQNYTLGTLVRTLAPARESNRVPLAEIQFNLERLGDRLDFSGLAASVVPNAKAFVNFDVFFNVIEASDGLRIDCDYNTDLFDRATIAGWLNDFGTMLDAMAADATVAIDAVTFAPALHGDALSSCDGPAYAVPRDATVATLF
ncbi:MAG: non-ribosomal peptide synthetase, partial [Candidatus Eremiobacteraeota bacterium]|nr:non-ribosomal peptide synthetase [Candidatus Eremiobacteraeota bacterium]